MTTRKKELLALSAVGCLMVAWTVGAAIVFLWRLDSRNGQDWMYLFTPAIIGIACAGSLVCILDFLYSILHEPLPPPSPTTPNPSSLGPPSGGASPSAGRAGRAR